MEIGGIGAGGVGEHDVKYRKADFYHIVVFRCTLRSDLGFYARSWLVAWLSFDGEDQGRARMFVRGFV